MVRITEVARRSRAARAGIRVGDELAAINGNEITDVLDYRFYLAEERVSLSLSRDGSPFTVEIEKEEYDDIGLSFETPLMDKKQTCRNKCVFCFIDQMPPGLRPSLYFKDDDARLSFLHGNYITLTNLTDRDVDRILKLHLSPINVSVHTTNPALRVEMMKNPHAGESLRHLYRMAKAGVELHGQIVLCRGINDGRELDRTLGDLAALYPALTSVSIVPAGLTRYREGLTPLSTFSPEECRTVIAQVDAVADRLFATHGSRLFFPSDEFYLEAGYPLPDEEFYEGYPQLENGVGMITSLRTEFAAWQEAGLALRHPRPRRISLATGVAAYPLMQELAARMCAAFPHLSVNVFCIENRFFGPHITVAGLLTARDIIDQLSGQELGRELLLPAATLRHEGDLFLDGMSLHEVEKALSVRIRTVESDGEDLARALLGLRRA